VEETEDHEGVKRATKQKDGQAPNKRVLITIHHAVSNRGSLCDEKPCYICYCLLHDIFDGYKVPATQFMLVQPFADDAGHVDYVREVVQEDVIRLANRVGMEGGL
jgi:hypothetical protein